MTERPHLVSGTIRSFSTAQLEPEGTTSESRKWYVEISEPITGLEEGANVRVVLWDERPKGSRSEIEEIARIQQLDIEIIATSLAREGALANERESFLRRLENVA